MNVTVHIERLVLDGVPVATADIAALRGAVEAEIARLVGGGRVPAGLLAGGAVPSLRGELTAPLDGSPLAWGAGIARVVHGSWGPSSEPGSATRGAPAAGSRGAR